MKLSDFLKMTEAQFEAMGVDDLTDLQHAASDWRDELKAQARVLVGVLDRKRQQFDAKRWLASMTDAEKAAMMQIVRDAGEIDSGEGFGKL